MRAHPVRAGIGAEGEIVISFGAAPNHYSAALWQRSGVVANESRHLAHGDVGRADAFFRAEVLVGNEAERLVRGRQIVHADERTAPPTIARHGMG